MQKLDIHNRSELVKFALEQGVWLPRSQGASLIGGLVKVRARTISWSSMLAGKKSLASPLWYKRVSPLAEKSMKLGKMHHWAICVSYTSGIWLLVGSLGCGSSSKRAPDTDANTSQPGLGGATGTGDALGSGGRTTSDSGAGGGPSTLLDARDQARNSDSSPNNGSDVSPANKDDAPPVGTDARGTDALPNSGVEQFVSIYARPYCTRLAACCAQESIPSSGLAACEANELSFQQYLADGSEVMVPAAIQTVLDLIKTSCDQPSYALLSTVTDGTRTPGQSCRAVDQCAGTPALCLLSPNMSDGTCMVPPRGKAGDGCAITCDDTSVCKAGTSGGQSPYSACYDQDGFRCDSKTSKCVAVTALGSTCADFSECGIHATCSNGTCQAKAKLGEDCGGARNCDSTLRCVASASGTAQTCQKLSIAWDGSCSP